MGQGSREEWEGMQAIARKGWSCRQCSGTESRTGVKQLGRLREQIDEMRRLRDDWFDSRRTDVVKLLVNKCRNHGRNLSKVFVIFETWSQLHLYLRRPRVVSKA